MPWFDDWTPTELGCSYQLFRCLTFTQLCTLNLRSTTSPLTMLVECLAQGYCRRGWRLLFIFPSQRVISNKAGDALEITKTTGLLSYFWEGAREGTARRGVWGTRVPLPMCVFEVKLISSPGTHTFIWPSLVETCQWVMIPYENQLKNMEWKPIFISYAHECHIAIMI